MSFDLEKAHKFISVEQVHHIALLDVRVFNTDRHPGNILLMGEKKPYTMVPIDHGCILPSWFHLSEARFDWLEYPQSRAAFSTMTMQYIDGLDVEKDAKPSEFNEQRGEIEKGVLCRRPPSGFLLVLEQMLVVAIKSDKP
ncbi:unnamed protein product [Peronospora effusa]|nr:unnamed protein product [Peronospora effusa]